MATLGARLIDNGYSILPIEPGTKRPGIYANGAWRPMSGWTRYCSRPTTLIECGIWSRWPDAGIGGACGSLVGADIDIVEDVQLAARVDELARRMLGDTSLVRVGMWPKRLLLYHAPEPFSGIKEFYPIEIMARGQQVVLYGIHPETEKPYQWIDDAPAEIHLTALPTVSEEQCREFCRAAYEMLPQALRRALSVDDAGTRHISSGRLTGTPAALESALEALPNPELDWRSWNHIGMALCAAVGGDGENAWHRWSSKAVKNDPKTTALTWRNYRRERIHSVGAGTIYYLAQQHGWHCPPDITMDAAAEWKLGSHPAQEIIDRRVEALPDPCGSSRDENIFVPDAFRQEKLTGFIAAFVEHTLASAIRPQPILAVAGALALTAAIAGRHYRSPTDLRTNLYVVSIAESGGGKDHVRAVISSLIAKAGLARISGGHRLVSGSGLFSALYRSPSCLFQLDEFGDFLTSILNAKFNNHKTEIWALLKLLATSAAGIVNGAEYTDQENRPRKDIVQPNCVVHATSEPESFWGAMKSRSVVDGGLARWLLFVTDDPIPTRNKTPRYVSDMPEDLITQAKAIETGADLWEPSGLGNGPTTDPNSYVIPYDRAGEALLDEIWQAADARQHRELGKGHGAILARWYEHIVRLALIYAISDSPGRPVITLAAVEWAQAIVDYCIATLLRDVDRWVADNEAESDLNRVLRVIRRAGLAGIAGADLANATRFLGGNRRRREDIVMDLAESGRITIAEMKSNGHGRPGRVYRVAQKERQLYT